jgi:hypothetical protein
LASRGDRQPLVVEPMGLSDWIGIFAIITFVGFAGMFYEVATRVFDD